MKNPDRYEVGTMIANTAEPGWNPYVLTFEGWVEVGSDATYPTDEHYATMWLGSSGWEVVYAGSVGAPSNLRYSVRFQASV